MKIIKCAIAFILYTLMILLLIPNAIIRIAYVLMNTIIEKLSLLALKITDKE